MNVLYFIASFDFTKKAKEQSLNILVKCKLVLNTPYRDRIVDM